MDDALLEKGRAALAEGSWEKAREILEQSVRVNESAQALEDLSWACWWMNDIPAVFDVRARAYQAFIDQGDKRGASRTASWLGLDCLELSGEFAVANGWFQRAESLLEGDVRCREYAIITNLKANLAFRAEHNPEKALALLEQSHSLAKSLNAMEPQMMAEALKGFILVTEGRVAEGMMLLDEATVMALSESSGDIRSVTTTCCFLIDACNRIRDYERADQWCVRVKEICKRWRHRAVFATCRTQYAAVLLWRGEWKEAEEELLAAIEELKAFRPVSVNAALVRLADLRRRQGRWSDASAILDEIKSHWMKQLICAELAFDRGFYEDALQAAEKFLRQIPSHEKTERITGVELLLRIYLQLGKMEEAVATLAELQEIEEGIATPPLRAARLYAEGMLERARKDYPVARRHLEDAIDIYEQLTSPFEASRARLALADVLSALGQRRQAEAELQLAIETFAKLGADKDVARARSMVRQFQPEAADRDADFTDREADILKLIAQGKNNNEIADKLFLSVRTVEKHLTNIYQKLGVAGKSARAFAAAYATGKKV
ncbi:MAG TPA: LuxR C-terminal-related transcriptional regulator [Chryseosolibacter sp.]